MRGLFTIFCRALDETVFWDWQIITLRNVLFHSHVPINVLPVHGTRQADQFDGDARHDGRPLGSLIAS